MGTLAAGCGRSAPGYTELFAPAKVRCAAGEHAPERLGVSDDTPRTSNCCNVCHLTQQPHQASAISRLSASLRTCCCCCCCCCYCCCCCCCSSRNHRRNFSFWL